MKTINQFDHCRLFASQTPLDQKSLLTHRAIRPVLFLRGAAGRIEGYTPPAGARFQPSQGTGMKFGNP
jgi:hypothetical protein